MAGVSWFVGTEEVDVAAGATVVVPTGVSRGSGRRPGWYSWEALASRVHPRRTDRTDARWVRRLVSAPPWVDARLRAEEAGTRSGSACTRRGGHGSRASATASDRCIAPSARNDQSHPLHFSRF